MDELREETIRRNRLSCAALREAARAAARARLFTGFLTLAPRCSHCGLDFSFADSGDGPAVFVSLIGGFIVLGAALWTELRL